MDQPRVLQSGMVWSHILFSEKQLTLSFFVLFSSGKLVSPKWKNFKGLKLQWRDKIRLNNAIWRAWYMQCKYVAGQAGGVLCSKGPQFCGMRALYLGGLSILGL